jgi:hypothetical protein
MFLLRRPCTLDSGLVVKQPFDGGLGENMRVETVEHLIEDRLQQLPGLAQLGYCFIVEIQKIEPFLYELRMRYGSLQPRRFPIDSLSH